MSSTRTLVVFVTMFALAALACTVGSPVLAPESTPAATPVVTEPTPSVESIPPTASFSRYEDAALGYTFDYPAGWVLQDNGSYVVVASGEDLLQAGADYSAGGALFIVAAGPLSDPTDGSLEDALDHAVSELETPPDAALLEGPTIREAGGQETIQTVISGSDETTGEPIIFLVAFVRRGDLAVVLSGTSLAANQPIVQPQFEAVVSSLLLPGDFQTVQQTLPDASGELLYGQTITGTIPPGESVAWTFQADQGDVLNITAGPTNASLDLVLNVVDSSGQSILSGGQVDDSLGTEEIGGLIIPADGAFSILLSGFLGSGGEYELVLAEATAAFGDISPGTVITGFLEAGGSDTFTFAAGAGTSLTLAAVPDPELDLILSVLAVGGDQIVSQDVGFGGEGEYIVFEPEEDGQYLLHVREFSGDGRGAYTLSIMSDATAHTVDENVVEAGGTIAYPLTLSAGQSVVAVASPLETFDIFLAVEDAQGQTLAQVDVGFDEATEILAFAPETPGDYVLRVGSLETGGGTFRLIVSTGLALAGGDNGAETPEQQVDLVPGTTLEALLAANATDTYTFSGRAGQEQTFFVLPTSTIDAVVDVTNADGTVLLNVDNGFTSEAETLTFTPDQNGEYQLHVHNFINGAGSYVVGMLDPSSALLNESGAVGSNVANRYDLPLAAGDRRIIMLFPEEGFDAVVEVLDAQGQPVATSDSGIASGPEVLLFESEAGGAYAIRVRGFVNAGGDYRLVVVRF